MSKNNIIKFKLIDKNSETNVYSVEITDSEELLGFVKWHDFWKQYCFYPMNSTTFSRGCMIDITDFISKITKEKRAEKKLEEDLHLI